MAADGGAAAEEVADMGMPLMPPMLLIIGDGAGDAAAMLMPPMSTCPASGATPACTVPVACRAASAAATCGLRGPIR